MVNEKEFDIRKPNSDYSAVEYGIGYCFEKYNLSKTSRFHLSIRKNLKKNVFEIYAQYCFRIIDSEIKLEPYNKILGEFETFEGAKDFRKNLYKSYGYF